MKGETKVQVRVLFRFHFFTFRIIAVTIGDKLFGSSVIGLRRPRGTMPDSARRPSQYKLSLASSCAMPYLWMKSALLSADWLLRCGRQRHVAARRYCFPIIQPAPSFPFCKAW